MTKAHVGSWWTCSQRGNGDRRFEIGGDTAAQSKKRRWYTLSAANGRAQQLVNLQNWFNYRGQLDVPSRGACKVTSQSLTLSDWQPDLGARG